MCSRYDHLNYFFRRIIAVDFINLCARHHDVAHRHVGNRQRALDDRQGVCIHQVMFKGAAQNQGELFAVLWFAQEQRGEAFKDAGLATGGRVHCSIVRVGNFERGKYFDFLRLHNFCILGAPFMVKALQM